MKKVELLKEIERIRSEMHKLAEQHSLFSLIVIDKSKELDKLLNQYQQFT